jgi:hypothetical protein
MRILGVILCLWLNAPALRAAVAVDRVAATVNRQAILDSDVEDEVRCQRFMQGRPAGEITAEDERAARARLIDRELLRQQMREGEIKPSGQEEIRNEIEQLKAAVKERGFASWDSALAQYGITEDGLRKRIASEFEQLRLVDSRLRPAVQIEPAEVQRYYREQFLPKLMQSGAVLPTQAEAAPKIREILTQQKMNQLLDSWVETLRSQADIKILEKTGSMQAGQNP